MFGAAAVLAALAMILLLISAAYGLVAAGPDHRSRFSSWQQRFSQSRAFSGSVGKRAIAKLGPPGRTIRTSKHTAAFLRARVLAMRRRRAGERSPDASVARVARPWEHRMAS